MYFKSQNSYLAAVYLRLSRDDGDKVESDSIRNQRSLLRDFANQHNDITLVKEYIDDGYSGANFERPGFQKMLEDAKEHKINCIIVKDLSRLGRNYIVMLYNNDFAVSAGASGAIFGLVGALVWIVIANRGY